MTFTEKNFIHYMKRFDHIDFEIILNHHTYRIGSGNPLFSVYFKSIPSAALLKESTSLALGEAYMCGDIQIKGDLYTALNCFLSQIPEFTNDHHRLHKLLYSSCSKKNQKKEVCAHYDLGNKFYGLWLDPGYNYSCGLFLSEEDTLEQAQQHKNNYILQKLYLKEGMTLCDIGCGWGDLLITAARKYKIHGTGITLSQAQKEKAEQRIRSAHLENYINIYLMDYRDLPSLSIQYDRIVSVGMLEHVGRGGYEQFFHTIKCCIKPEGLFLLHFISAMQEHPGDPWIKKYIFPGGVIPSLREIMYTAGDFSFYTLHLESLRRHYTRTLRCWYNNVCHHQPEIISMFDKTFFRMWELYLCSCAAAFENGIVDVHQILFSNGHTNKLPLNKWF